MPSTPTTVKWTLAIRMLASCCLTFRNQSKTAVTAKQVLHPSICPPPSFILDPAGVPDCSTGCRFIHDNSLTEKVLLTNSTVIQYVALGVCELFALAVGGGGEGGRGGGGSSFVKWAAKNITGRGGIQVGELLRSSSINTSLCRQCILDSRQSTVDSRH